jgi:enoyl-[acyl-carrier protein] reductase II
MKSPVTKLFNTTYPVIQGGMIWCSGWKLATAVSAAGGLGLIGAGSMSPEIFRENVRKANHAAKGKFGVNVPLIYSHAEEIMEIIVDEEVKVVFTSAGNPKTWTPFLKEKGIKVAHVVSSKRFAIKCQEAGVDAVVAEGFEAGGHNGREETTTMTLIPMVREAVSIPVIAAGGIVNGRGMLAAFALGADGVQMGTRFAASEESSAHENFKRRIIETHEGDTELVLKNLIPVRLIKNEFYGKIKDAENAGASKDELLSILGTGRAKTGMFEGELTEGELEIGQASAMVDKILPVNDIIQNLIHEFHAAKKELLSL